MQQPPRLIVVSTSAPGSPIYCHLVGQAESKPIADVAAEMRQANPSTIVLIHSVLGAEHAAVCRAFGLSGTMMMVDEASGSKWLP
jgi:hypothetical protein